MHWNLQYKEYNAESRDKTIELKIDRYADENALKKLDPVFWTTS